MQSNDSRRRAKTRVPRLALVPSGRETRAELQLQSALAAARFYSRQNLILRLQLQWVAQAFLDHFQPCTRPEGQPPCLVCETGHVRFEAILDELQRQGPEFEPYGPLESVS